jgi:hypothetical protein
MSSSTSERSRRKGPSHSLSSSSTLLDLADELLLLLLSKLSLRDLQNASVTCKRLVLLLNAHSAIFPSSSSSMLLHRGEGEGVGDGEVDDDLPWRCLFLNRYQGLLYHLHSSSSPFNSSLPSFSSATRRGTDNISYSSLELFLSNRKRKSGEFSSCSCSCSCFFSSSYLTICLLGGRGIWRKEYISRLQSNDSWSSRQIIVRSLKSSLGILPSFSSSSSLFSSSFPQLSILEFSEKQLLLGSLEYETAYLARNPFLAFLPFVFIHLGHRSNGNPHRTIGGAPGVPGALPGAPGGLGTGGGAVGLGRTGNEREGEDQGQGRKKVRLTCVRNDEKRKRLAMGYSNGQGRSLPPLLSFFYFFTPHPLLLPLLPLPPLIPLKSLYVIGLLGTQRLSSVAFSKQKLKSLKLCQMENISLLLLVTEKVAFFLLP